MENRYTRNPGVNPSRVRNFRFCLPKETFNLFSIQTNLHIDAQFLNYNRIEFYQISFLSYLLNIILI